MTEDENKMNSDDKANENEARADDAPDAETSGQADREADEAKGDQPSNEQFGLNSGEDKMDEEMAPPEERELEDGELLSKEEALTDAEDNAKIDSEEVRREVGNDEGITLEDPPERDYAIGSNMVRNLFVGSGIGAVVLIVVILTLTSAIDQARYTPADETQYRRTLADATEELTDYAQGENGRASIPIDQAIAITAERGLGEINGELGVPQPQAQGQQQAQPQQQTQSQQQGQQNQQAQNTQGDQQAQSSEGGAGAEAAQEGGPPEVMLAGESVFTTNCVSCHQANGQGIPGAFPTLANHVPSLYNADRTYLVNVLLYGLQGQIQVNGQSYNGVMTAWGQLGDQEIADVLNYVSTAWDNNQNLQDFQPYAPEEIAAERGKGLSSSDVLSQRPSQ